MPDENMKYGFIGVSIGSIVALCLSYAIIPNMDLGNGLYNALSFVAAVILISFNWLVWWNEYNKEPI